MGDEAADPEALFKDKFEAISVNVVGWLLIKCENMAVFNGGRIKVLFAVIE